MLTVYVRGVIVYLILIAVIRLLGKRQLGQMEPSEVVVTMLVADLASAPMEDPQIPIFMGLIPIFGVLTMELLLSRLSMKSLRLRKLFCGKPVILIENGRFLQKNLRKNRITLDELISQLRQKDVLDVGQVQYAILETGGNLSVFPFPEDRPASARDAGLKPPQQSIPITVISDGKVMGENLKKSGKDLRWLERTLRARNATVEKTFLLTVDRGNTVRFYPKQP